MVAAPTTPSRTLAERPISEVAVSVRMTLSSNRRTPPAKIVSFALFRVVSLDHPNAAQRFREPPCHLGVDLAALAENGPDRREGLVQGEGKATERTDGDQRQRRR